jgi:hypothetical protein
VERLEPEMSSSEIFEALFELELNGKVRQLPEEFCEELLAASFWQATTLKRGRL